MTSNITPQRDPAWLRAGAVAAGRLADDPRRAALAAFFAESDSLAALQMLHTLLRLEFCVDHRWRITDRRQQLRIAPCYNPLLQRWHQHLLAEGLLDNDSDGWTLAACAPAAHQLEQRIDDARHRLRQLMNWLDDAAPLADALFSRGQQFEDWLYAPSLALAHPPMLNLHQLLPLPGIIGDYFADIALQVLPLLLAESGRPDPSLLTLGPLPPRLQGSLGRIAAAVNSLDDRRSLAAEPAGVRYDAVIVCGLLERTDPYPLLAGLSARLVPGGVLIVLQNSAERPLHWVTPAALQAHAHGGPQGTCAEPDCAQLLQEAGFTLLQGWPQASSPMAFCGQRLWVARRARCFSPLR